jgi:hypothetical protein
MKNFLVNYFSGIIFSMGLGYLCSRMVAFVNYFVIRVLILEKKNIDFEFF